LAGPTAEPVCRYDGVDDTESDVVALALCDVLIVSVGTDVYVLASTNAACDVPVALADDVFVTDPDAVDEYELW
jgi:hypothetical protein